LTRLGVGAFALTLVGTILGGIWASVNWGRFWNWDARETVALLMLLWQAALLFLLWRCAGKPRWLACWAILGNVTVTYAWFVTAVLHAETQPHAYGASRSLIVTLFVTILVTHLLLMAASIAPSGWLRIRKTSA